MQKHLALAPGGVVRPRSLQVFGNVDVLDPRFTAVNVGVAVSDGSTTFAQRFHFRAGEDQARFEFLFQVVVKRGTAIARDDLFAVVFDGFAVLLRQVLVGSFGLGRA